MLHSKARHISLLLDTRAQIDQIGVPALAVDDQAMFYVLRKVKQSLILVLVGRAQDFVSNKTSCLLILVGRIRVPGMFYISLSHESSKLKSGTLSKSVFEISPRILLVG